MRFILGSLIACVAIFFAVPIMIGGSVDLCQDVPPAVPAASTAASDDPMPIYNVIPPTTAAAEHDKEVRLHPHAPPVVSCTAAFWQSL